MRETFFRARWRMRMLVRPEQGQFPTHGMKSGSIGRVQLARTLLCRLEAAEGGTREGANEV